MPLEVVLPKKALGALVALVALELAVATVDVSLEVRLVEEALVAELAHVAELAGMLLLVLEVTGAEMRGRELMFFNLLLCGVWKCFNIICGNHLRKINK